VKQGRTRSGERVCEYFLAEKGGATSPFLNRRHISNDVSLQLLHHGIVDLDRTPELRGGWFFFTDAAQEWHRRYGGPDDDKVRRGIGRKISRRSDDQQHEFRVNELAGELRVSPERVQDQIGTLLDLRLIQESPVDGAEFGPLRLTSPAGIHWAAGGFQPVSTLNPGIFSLARDVPLSAVPSLVHRNPSGSDSVGTGEEKNFDVFICHASEDKEPVVRPLAHALRDAGFAVWYDEFELRIGDSLRRKIDHGIANSRLGVVVLSEAFFAKDWPNYELDGLVTQDVSGEQGILPIWHKISKREVITFSPPLAGKIARNTTDWTVEEIAAEIAEVIRAAR
jgi:hypothetical protein